MFCIFAAASCAADASLMIFDGSKELDNSAFRYFLKLFYDMPCTECLKVFQLVL